MEKQRPRVGLGVIVLNDKGEILIGKRKGAHAPFYSIPGGNLELGETFEDGAIRELKEEADITIIDPKVTSLTNNLKTFREEGLHYLSVLLIAKKFEGEVKIMEPHKCEEWLWVDPHNLPEPHFEASTFGVQCYLQNKFYLGAS